jgi:trk system potassium uptake protein TrkA
MDILDLVHPEKEAAQQLSHRLTYNLGQEMLFIDQIHSVTETPIPSWMENKRLADLDIRGKFSVNIISVLRKEKISQEGQQEIFENRCKGVINPDFVFQAGDIMVTFGKNNDIRKLIDFKG